MSSLLEPSFKVKATGTLIVVGIYLLFWVPIILVAVHFIRKFW